MKGGLKPSPRLFLHQAIQLLSLVHTIDRDENRDGDRSTKAHTNLANQ